MARASRNFDWVVDLPFAQMSNGQLYRTVGPRRADAHRVLIGRLKTRRRNRRIK